MRTRVKICGITNLADALTACEAGADALGFVFYPNSKRNIELDQAAEIIANLPAFVTTVALFVNPQPDLVAEVIKQTKVDLLQFHGTETAEFCEQFSRPYIKAIAMKSQEEFVTQLAEHKAARGFLLDTYVPGIPGGTGKQFNWDLIEKWLPKETAKPLVLAGGLTPENVAQAIAQTKVFAVDVSGGVEDTNQTNGKKCPTKIQQFIKNASCNQAWL